MNLLHLFAIPLRDRPGAAALRLPGGPAGDLRAPGETLSYAGLFAAAGRVASHLAGRGLGPGDRVALLAGASPELVAVHLALLELGAVAVPVNLAYREREVGHLLTDAAPRLVVAGEEEAELVARVPAAARRSVEGVVPIAELGGAVGSGSRSPTGAAPREPEPDGSDPALLIYTSGTTGESKGAVLTHDNLLATVTGLMAAWAWRPEDRLLLSLPLFHVHGLVVGLFTALAAGASVELHRRFDAAAVLERLDADEGGDGPNLFFGVPTMYVRLLRELRRRAEEGRPADLSGVRLFASGSAPLAPETFHGFRDATGHEILERYGMSETGMNLSNPYAGARLPGTVGVPLPGVSVRIVDPERLPEGGGPAKPAPLPDGEAGELLVRGANVFAGYRGDPEKTAASFVTETGEDGRPRSWFRTGDLARRDPETGYVTLLGRRHDLIVRGGLNVYPREIEEVLERFPGVREAAVAARPDPEYGEVPVAYLVADEGVDVDLEALLAHCRAELAPFKVPTGIRFLDELPRNALGKVRKHRLPD